MDVLLIAWSQYNDAIIYSSSLSYFLVVFRVFSRHMAMLWTSPKNERGVSSLAMKWRTNLMEHGCESFLERGKKTDHTESRQCAVVG